MTYAQYFHNFEIEHMTILEKWGRNNGKQPADLFLFLIQTASVNLASLYNVKSEDPDEYINTTVQCFAEHLRKTVAHMEEISANK